MTAAEVPAPAPMRIAVAGARGRVGSRVVELLGMSGHDVVPMSRADRVDVISGDGLAEALVGVECVIDAASGTARGAPAPPRAAREFFTTAARNLHEFGLKAGVQRMVEVSVIGIDHFTTGLGAAKHAHEQAMLAGPVPVRVLRAAQFHEFVPQLVEWGTDGGLVRVREMRVRSVAARAVARALVDLATDPAWAASPAPSAPPFPEIAGPREETLAGMVELYLARRGIPLRVRTVTDPDDPGDRIYADGRMLPGPHATLAGPTFREWLDAGSHQAG